ncbi:BnaC06g26900D [Brassica napus]|uniref:BnaC06g26900D protein n=1 Tax=Brassica napus TaxID=3708 RepID=A0A078GUX4_BRANA|nr:BnaC06g26900D [Brassica napus]
MSSDLYASGVKSISVESLFFATTGDGLGLYIVIIITPFLVFVSAVLLPPETSGELLTLGAVHFGSGICRWIDMCLHQWESDSTELWGYFSVKSGGGIHEFSDSQFGHVFLHLGKPEPWQ